MRRYLYCEQCSQQGGDSDQALDPLPCATGETRQRGKASDEDNFWWCFSLVPWSGVSEGMKEKEVGGGVRGNVGERKGWKERFQIWNQHFIKQVKIQLSFSHIAQRDKLSSKISCNFRLDLSVKLLWIRCHQPFDSNWPESWMMACFRRCCIQIL